MAAQTQAIDVFYDMDIAQICQHFSKSRNTVDKAVAKLIKDYPDKNWKYKNPETKRITIKAEGVEKLSTYFRKEKHEVSTVEMELRFENEKLQAILEEKEKTITAMEHLYQEKLRLELEKSRQTFLLESKNQADRITALESEKSALESENQKIKEDSVKTLEEKEKSLKEQSDRITDLESLKQELESENQKLKSDQEADSTTLNQLKKEAEEKTALNEKYREQEEEYRKRREEYNSKSPFYRFFHKFEL